jgi:hypothetical protein
MHGPCYPFVPLLAPLPLPSMSHLTTLEEAHGQRTALKVGGTALLALSFQTIGALVCMVTSRAR